MIKLKKLAKTALCLVICLAMTVPAVDLNVQASADNRGGGQLFDDEAESAEFSEDESIGSKEKIQIQE